MKITEELLRTRVRNMIENSGWPAAEWSRQHGFSPTNINDFLCGRRRCPPPLAKLLKAKRVIMYEVDNENH